jgi:hypothetical protein
VHAQLGFDAGARARALIGYLATRELSVAGSEVARRFMQDRSAVSRAAARAGRDAEMRKTAKALLRELTSIKNQR